MRRRQREPELPREVISLKTYAQLDLYLAKFASGELSLVLLLGRHGTGKSESVKQALGISLRPARLDEARPRVLYAEGHMQPFGLYRHLWEYRDRPVVLDDLDKLYANSDCVGLLKALCNTGPAKRISWLTNITLNSSDVPSSFTTSSRVILIANEWRTINPNVRALEDRAIILHFDPSNGEVHRRVQEWFEDPEVYGYIARIIRFMVDSRARPGRLSLIFPKCRRAKVTQEPYYALYQHDLNAALLQGVATATSWVFRLAQYPAANGPFRSTSRLRGVTASRTHALLRTTKSSEIRGHNRGFEGHIFQNESPIGFKPRTRMTHSFGRVNDPLKSPRIGVLRRRDSHRRRWHPGQITRRLAPTVGKARLSRMQRNQQSSI